MNLLAGFDHPWSAAHRDLRHLWRPGLFLLRAIISTTARVAPGSPLTTSLWIHREAVLARGHPPPIDDSCLLSADELSFDRVGAIFTGNGSNAKLVLCLGPERLSMLVLGYRRTSPGPSGPLSTRTSGS